MTTPLTVNANYFSKNDCLHLEFPQGILRIKGEEAQSNHGVWLLWNRLVAQIKADDAAQGAVDSNFFSKVILQTEDLVCLLMFKARE